MGLQYQELSTAAQSAFAGLDVAAKQTELDRSVAHLPGGFAKKTIHGRTYWYHQVKSADQKPIQTYIGPDDDETRALMAAHSGPVQAGAQQQATLHMRQLTRAALEYGCSEIPNKHAKVITRLADHGFFRAGGILVGTHAFLAYQNHLGLRWQAGGMTLDLDFAHAGKNISIALPSNLTIDTRSAIESLQMGFVPIQSQTTYKKTDEPDFDLDFLTSMGRGLDTPVHIDALNVTLQPLRFMELSLEAPMRATLLSRSGPVVVNVPQPERFALHKLIVFVERRQEMRLKAIKDLAQAGSVIHYLLENDPDLLHAQWQDVVSRGPGWQSRLEEGFAALCQRYPAMNFAQRLPL